MINLATPQGLRDKCRYFLTRRYRNKGAALDYVDFSGKRCWRSGCGDGRLTWRYAIERRTLFAIDPKAERLIEIAVEECPPSCADKIEFARRASQSWTSPQKSSTSPCSPGPL